MTIPGTCCSDARAALAARVYRYKSTPSGPVTIAQSLLLLPLVPDSCRPGCYSYYTTRTTMVPRCGYGGRRGLGRVRPLTKGPSFLKRGKSLAYLSLDRHAKGLRRLFDTLQTDSWNKRDMPTEYNKPHDSILPPLSLRLLLLRLSIPTIYLNLGRHPIF